VRIHEATGPELLDELRLGRIDVALLFLSATTEGFATSRMFDVELGVIVPLDHRLASRQTLRLRDLRGENWISFPAEHPGRRWLDEAFAKIGQRPRLEAEVESLAQLKAQVEARLGLSIVLLSAVSAEVLAGQIRAIRLSPVRRVAVGYVTDPDHRSHAVMAVRSALEALKQ
jgi:LysR family nitrogen assimilation transcriptional regulator